MFPNAYKVVMSDGSGYMVKARNEAEAITFAELDADGALCVNIRCVLVG